MRLHVLSALVGMAVLPSFAALWWAGWRARQAAWRTIRAATPTSPANRAAFAARVYSGRRVLVFRFRETAMAFTLGRIYSDEQRAAGVLLKEFTLIPPAAARIKGRTW